MFAKNKQRHDSELETSQIDWVVVAAACVAVGLLSMMLVAGTVKTHSMEVHADVLSHEFEAEFDAVVEFTSQ